MGTPIAPQPGDRLIGGRGPAPVLPWPGDLERGSGLECLSGLEAPSIKGAFRMTQWTSTAIVLQTKPLFSSATCAAITNAHAIASSRPPSRHTK